MTDNKPQRPPDWSDQEWAEFLAWHDGLPEDVEGPGVSTFYDRATSTIWHYAARYIS